MAIKFAAKDEVRSAPAKSIREAEAKAVVREDVTAVPKLVIEAVAPSAAGTDLFDSAPKAPARKRKIK